MAKRLFVCHAKSAIESTSEAVDILENALDFSESSLFTSSLPGYSSDTRSEEELHSMLAGTSLVLALLTEASVEDQEFSFELGAAWSLGIEIVPVLLGDTHPLQLPWPLREYRVVRGDEPGAWDTLIADVSERLGVPLLPLQAAMEVAPPAPLVLPSAPWPAPEDELIFGSSVSIAPVVRLQELESPAPATIPPVSSDVFSRLPTCEMSLEAGRAVADCIFNRAEISNFESELGASLGLFVDAMGGSWSELRKMEDLDVWVGATENLLEALPPKLERVSEWYRLGFELSTLHNLAGQLVFDAGTHAEAEQQWRVALDRFLTRAENARIGYEELGRVLSLLENLAGPSSERDLTNIGRSLEEVRRYAAGADGIHTAA